MIGGAGILLLGIEEVVARLMHGMMGAAG
jgi:hypothetical protein